MTSVSVVIPVRDGGPLLAEVLQAVQTEEPDELIVIDSGSVDGSQEVARRAGAQLVEIPPAKFGHGRTRNLAAAEASSEIICFLTQDATPVAGWLNAYREVFGTNPQVGAAFGPHLPRPGTSPMIARELEGFFAGFSEGGSVSTQGSFDQESWHPGFLSNVNAAYRRDVLLEIRFRDVPYSEDQAFAADLFAAGWLKAYVPGAATLHAHDYPFGRFMRRYFDEYRGLRDSVGHVEEFAPTQAIRTVRHQLAGDINWMDERGYTRRRKLLWIPKAAAHHSGRQAAALAGSRADRLPAFVQKALSLEGRSDPRPTGGTSGSATSGSALVTEPVPPVRRTELFSEILDLEYNGIADLAPAISGMSERQTLHIAVVIPPFRRGSGGHDTIFRILRHIEQMGHTVSIWLSDPLGRMENEWPAVVRRRIREEFVELDAPVFKGFGDWFGADVALATSWETVYPMLELPGCRSRAYFVQDHEPEFFASSAESVWAENSYRQGLFTICASPWLADIMRERYGAASSVFQLGVDRDIYYPREVTRQPNTVAYYGRASTPRRAVSLGILALAELNRRRDVRIVLYGDPEPPDSTFPFENLGIASQEELALLYSEATVGLCLSVTNYSRAPQEMMACGLPCVDLAGFSSESVFGEDGPVELSEFSPTAIADHIEKLMDDPGLWKRRSAEGLAFAAEHSWEAAAVEVEAGLREALRERQ